MELNELQQKLNHAFHDAQEKAVARAKELDHEARKILEALGDRAQAELKVLVDQARDLSRDQLATLGAELQKLGKKLQDLAAQPPTAGKKTKANSSSVQ